VRLSLRAGASAWASLRVKGNGPGVGGVTRVMFRDRETDPVLDPTPARNRQEAPIEFNREGARSHVDRKGASRRRF
jgi:hypothetical protein